MQKDEYGISKITLGTAQFGFKYGINSQGQPTQDEAFRMLRYAFANNVNAVDTAPNYGNSQRIIGELMRIDKAWETFTITKLEAQSFPDEVWDDKKALSEKVEKEFWLSCVNLNVRKIPAYLLHFADQAFRDGGVILDILVKLKRQGYIEFIGTSLYTGEELERCIDDKRIDVVQLPFSILDRRLLESGLLRKANERGLIIFARSVFFQGLIFMDRLPIKLWNAREVIRKLYRLAFLCGMSVNELCLRYVLSINEVSSAVIGVDNIEQLKENIRVASLGPLDKDVLKEIEKLLQMPAELIDIRSWGQDYKIAGGGIK